VSTHLDAACEWAASLRLEDIPPDVRDLAIAQSISAAGAAQATLRHPVGERLRGAVPGEGWAAQAATWALLTMALDFDETAFAGHLGHACALPILACGVEAGASGERVLVAQVAAAEVAARVTAAVTLGSARGQTAAHTHAAGMAVGVSLILGLSPGEMTSAVSLALAQPRRVLLPAFMGSDAKFWVAATPILDAARSVRLAQAGAVGLPAVLEAPGGVLSELADVPLPQVFGGYGERWHLRTLSIKAVPGCTYLTAAVEAAAELGPLDLDEVAGVEARVSIFTLGMEAQSAPFLAGPQTPLPALGFSVGYNVAAALERGGLDVDDLHGPDLGKADRWRVAGAVRLEHDEELTVAALSATAPVGAAIAWAGASALPYLTDRGAGASLAARVIDQARAADPTFAAASKRIGARLRVSLRDGRILECRREAAAASCQESVSARLAAAGEKLRSQLERRPDAPAGLVDSYLNLAGLSAAEVRGLLLAGRFRAGPYSDVTGSPATASRPGAQPRSTE
jgi:2-methylcitrate dehydratase PrpD